MGRQGGIDRPHPYQLLLNTSNCQEDEASLRGGNALAGCALSRRSESTALAFWRVLTTGSYGMNIVSGKRNRDG